MRRRVRSFGHAAQGLAVLFSTQTNARIHLLAAVVVGVAGGSLGLSASEWAALVLASCAVFVAEALNTAIEFLADAAVPEQHPLIRRSKDVAAGAVLLSAIGAVVVGTLVFAPQFC